MKQNSEHTDQSYSILRIEEVIKRTGVPRSTIYYLIEKGRFPSNIKMGERSAGWIEHEVQAWIEHRISERNQAREGEEK